MLCSVWANKGISRLIEAERFLHVDYFLYFNKRRIQKHLLDWDISKISYNLIGLSKCDFIGVDPVVK